MDNMFIDKDFPKQVHHSLQVLIQPVALCRNCLKAANDLLRDGKMVSAYEKTIFNEAGLYLIFLHRQPVTDLVNFEQACRVVDDSETARQCAGASKLTTTNTNSRRTMASTTRSSFAPKIGVIFSSTPSSKQIQTAA